MSRIQALQAQARGAVPTVTMTKGVNVSLRTELVKALRSTGKFSEVSAIADTRSGVKVYLALRGTILNDIDYRNKVEKMAKEKGFDLSISLTSGSAYQKRFRVNTLQRSASVQKADLFTAMADTKPVAGTVVVEGKTYTNLSADAIRQIKALVDRENVVEIRVVNVNTMAATRIKVPVVVRDAITGKTPRFSFASRYSVLTTQGLTILTVDGSKYVLAD